MIMPHQTSMPASWMRWTFSSSVPPVRTFWNFLASRSESSSGLSMPTKTAMKLASDHQLHQLGVIGQVDRRLGEKRQRIAVPLLPGDHVAQHGLDGLLVADQVVIDDEDDRACPDLRIASSSAMTWAPVLMPRAGGRR